MSEHLAPSWRRVPLAAWDAALAAAGTVVAVIALAIGDHLDSYRVFAALAVVALVCVCSAFARRVPVTAALAACPLILVGVFMRDWSTFQTATDGLIVPIFLLAYHLGSTSPVARSLGVIVLLAGCCQATATSVNPFILIDTAGPWIVGFIARSRAKATAELERQGQELEREQARLEAESVRYERTRIARELHDIVAHCVTVMVVQAGAAQYLAGRDTQGALDALDGISESARQAEAEIARLVAVLGEPADLPATTIDQLVDRTRATGLAISYAFVGDADRLSVQTLDTAYRIAREAVTNALKHAPGARVDILLRCTDSGVQLQVSNAAPRATSLDLTHAGGGHGLAGIRERVIASGGQLQVGPTDDGGWQVMAHLPVAAHVSL